MAERYIKVYSLDGMMYTEGSPVILSAAALLKDTLNGEILALLKWQNIGDRRIKAITVKIDLYNVAGNPTGETITHQYLDFSVGRDEVFGAKEPLKVGNPIARSFSVSVCEVIFEDNGVWRSESVSEWLPPQKPLSDTFTDPCAHDEFRLMFGEPCIYTLRVHRDIWQCACGAVNRVGEEVCHACGNERQAMTTITEEDLHASEVYRTAHEAATGCTAEEVEKAVALFASLGNWEDAPLRAQQCRDRARELREQAERDRSQKIARHAKNKKIAAVSAVLVTAAVLILSALLVAMRQQKMSYYGAAYEIVKDSEVGDRITYGNYEQDGVIENGTEPIEWIVLAKEKNRVLVISNYVLDCQPYNASGNYTRWEGSSIKKWTNGTFVETAFTLQEQRSVLEAFLLSGAEVSKYVRPLDADIGIATDYVLQNTNIINKKGTCRWWTRVIVEGEASARVVDFDGRSDDWGTSVERTTVGVRPAMWISLEN